MANTTARWHGDNYQSRHFWLYAALLLDDQQPNVVEVTFEAEGPKSFDDIVVKYDPPRPNKTGTDRVSADYFQIKWHTDDSGHFGYKDFVEPSFIGATSMSLLQRLRDAKRTCDPGSAFHLVTTYNISEKDPLSEIIYHVDGSLRLEKLFDGTKTDTSRMGEVRKLWREHLELSSNEQLEEVLSGFYVERGAMNLEALRKQVTLHFRVVRLKGRESETTFIYDEAARDLAGKKMNRLDRDRFRKYCDEEDWFIPIDLPVKRGISIQVYNPRALPSDLALASQDNTLMLSHHFNGRQIRREVSWNTVRDELSNFLVKKLADGPEIRLFVEAPSSLAFLSGACLGLKSGASVEIVQTGYGNPSQVWDANDGSSGPKPTFTHLSVGKGRDIALVLSLTRNALPKVEEFVRRDLSSIDRIIHVTPDGGPGQKSIKGGEHAMEMAQAVAEEVANTMQFGGRIHVFLAAPNAFSFYLGQQTEAMGVCIPYEFDLKKTVDGSYIGTFEIDPNAP